MDRTIPKPGEVWVDRRGKRRMVISIEPARGAWPPLVVWDAIGPNSGQSTGSMELDGWYRRGWRLEGKP